VIPGIDNAAHFGGLVTGALLGVALGRPLLREQPIGTKARVTASFALALLVALFAFSVPAPRYRLGEEMQARSAIRQFLADEHRINDRWKSIIDAGRSGGASFDELAGHIDSDVSREYQDSFEQLSSIALSPGAPSAADLEFLRRYALLRGDAAHDLAEALRANDLDGIRRALDKMRQAQAIARSASAASR
jgi:rhomboid protease GluP